MLTFAYFYDIIVMKVRLIVHPASDYLPITTDMTIIYNLKILFLFLQQRLSFHLNFLLSTYQ